LESVDDDDFIAMSKVERTAYIKELWTELSADEKAEYKVSIPFVADEPVKNSQKNNFFRTMRTTNIGYDDYDGKSEKVKRDVIQGMWDDLTEEEKTEYSVYEPTQDSVRLEKELASKNSALRKCSPDAWDYVLNKPIKVQVEPVVDTETESEPDYSAMPVKHSENNKEGSITKKSKSDKKMSRRSKFIKFMKEDLADDAKFMRKSEEDQDIQLKKQWSNATEEEKEMFSKI
jgi:hypothetical protein